MIAPNISFVVTVGLCPSNRTLIATHFTNYSVKLLGDRIFIMPTLISEALKGKAVPLQAWSGPEGSRKLRFPDFITTAQDGGKVVSLTHGPPLLPGNAPGTRFC